MPLGHKVLQIGSHCCGSQTSASAAPGDLVLTDWGPAPRVSDSVGLGWSQRICISNHFSEEAGAGV